MCKVWLANHKIFKLVVEGITPGPLIPLSANTAIMPTSLHCSLSLGLSSLCGRLGPNPKRQLTLVKKVVQQEQEKVGGGGGGGVRRCDLSACNRSYGTTLKY
jgi:hypothetical protein